MRMLNKLAFFYLMLLPLLVPAQVRAQEAMQTVTVQADPQRTVTATSGAEVEMADTLRRDGKIYIVVLVVLTVLAGVLFYLIRLDQKVSRLEKEHRT
jgi:chorismate synthase